MPNTSMAASASLSPPARSYFLPLLLVATAVSRWLCWESFISGLDSGNYWLGISDFSIANERPHAPGYPVFILLCRAAGWLLGNQHHSLLLVVTLLSVAAVWASYRLAMELFNQPVARATALLLACNPLFFLYGITAENYAFDALCSSLLILLGLRAGRGRAAWLWFGIAVGVSIGFRGTSVILLAPALACVLFHQWRAGGFRRQALASLLAGILAGVACWLPWVVAEEGGVWSYLHAATNLSPTSAGTFLGNLAGFTIAGFWGVNIAWMYLAFRWKSFAHFRFRHFTFRRALLWCWVLPIVLFFALVIYAKGYGLLILPACSMAVAWLAVNEQSRWRRIGVVGGMVAANLAIFFLLPYRLPPYFTAIAPQNRTAEQRAESVVGRGFSVLLPTLSRVRANDKFVGDGLELIDRATWGREDSALVVIDPAAQMLLVGRVVQVYRPRLRVAVPSTFRRNAVVFLHGVDWEERQGSDADFNSQQIILLTRNELAKQYLEIGGTMLKEQAPFALLKFSREQGYRLRQQIDQLFTR